MQQSHSDAGSTGSAQLTARDVRVLLRVGVALVIVVALALLIGRLAHVLMLAFGAAVVAAILWRTARLTERFTPLNLRWSKAVAWLTLMTLAALAFWLLGSRVMAETGDLLESIPRLVNDLGQRFGREALWSTLSEQANRAFDVTAVFGSLAGYGNLAIEIGGTIFVIVFGGAFLAVEPQVYRNGLVKLLPFPWSERLGEAIDEAAHSLSGWLIGKVIAMVVVGVLTTVTLMLLGLPSALALGLLAGILEFIPLVGPLLSAIPAGLIAIQMGYDKLLWVVAIYFGLQQVESNVLTPLVQQKTADLPPVLGLFAIVAAGSLFGPIGVVFGAPLAIVVMTLVKRLYVQDVLSRDVEPTSKN